MVLIPFRIQFTIQPPHMIRNYFKIAWRNLSKHKLYSAINIVGLATGMAACIVILLFVFYEKSFDNIHSKNIYRLNEVQKFPGMVASQKVALSMFPMGPTLKEDFPQIRNFTRINWDDNYQMTFGEKRIYLPQIFFVDTTFLAMFDFPLLKGNRQNALEKPNSAVLTESGARKLFGNENPIGKTITHYGGDTLSYTVTGILKDVPNNSQLQFDALFSFNTRYKPDWMNYWGGNWLDTYLELAPGTDIASLEKKFPAYLKKHMTGDNDGWKYYELFLLPFRDVHANSADIGLDYINFQKFDKSYTRIFHVDWIDCTGHRLHQFHEPVHCTFCGKSQGSGHPEIHRCTAFSAWHPVSWRNRIAVPDRFIACGCIGICRASLYRKPQPEKSEISFMGTSRIAGCCFCRNRSRRTDLRHLSVYLPLFFSTHQSIEGFFRHCRNKKSNFRNILVVGQFVSAIFLIIATIFVFRQFNLHEEPGSGICARSDRDDTTRRHHVSEI